MLKIQINNKKFLFLLLFFSTTSLASEKEITIPGTLHTFYMDNGEKRYGSVIKGEGDWIRIQVQREENSFSQKPMVAVLLKRKSVQKVRPLEWDVWEFAEKDRETLEQGWNRMNCLLGLPGARVGTLGNALARILINQLPDKVDVNSSTSCSLLQTAQNLYGAVEEKSCDPEEKITARIGRLRTWMIQGKNHRVIDEVKVWADPPVEAWDILGESLLVEIEKLIQEHPCWQQDPFVKSKITELVNTCLDSSLLTFARYPFHKKYAAEGLLRSIRIYNIIRNTKLAKASALDVLAFYPQFQKQAEQLLKNLESEN